MRVLVELYDEAKPVNNFITGLAMKPDVIAYLGETAIWKENMCERVQRVYADECPDVEFVWHFHAAARFDAICQSLEWVFERYGAENCVIDVTGGSELMLLAVGRLYERYQTAVVAYRPTSHAFLQFSGSDIGVESLSTPRFTIAQAIAMCGGTLMRNGHGAALRDSREALNKISALFRISGQDHAAWTQFVEYFQHINHPPYRVNSTYFSAPRSVKSGGAVISCPGGILFALCDEGIIRDLALNSTYQEFSLTQECMADCLSDYGLVLELYVYEALRRCGLFDDVDMSDVICWDDDELDENNVVNEIDAIALAGVGQLFISCKSGVVTTNALNELVALTQRFGNGYATPVLVTLNKLPPALSLRTQGMGITTLAVGEFTMEELIGRFKNMARAWK